MKRGESPIGDGMFNGRWSGHRCCRGRDLFSWTLLEGHEITIWSERRDL